MKISDIQYKGFKLYILDKKNKDDKRFLSPFSETIFNVLKDAYEQKGSCHIYKTIEEMKGMVDRYKIVMDDDNNIYGVATYRHRKLDDGYKCILIGRNFSLDKEDGKISVQWIIKSDIINWKKMYWIEAYDAVGYWEETYGAFPIPSSYVTHILDGKYDIILDENDEYKYYRKIKGLKESQPKKMYGFSGLDMIEKLLDGEQYQQYEQQIKDLYDGKVHNSMYENRVSKFDEFRFIAVMRSMDFIEDRYSEQMEFRNVTPELLEIIQKVCDEAKRMMYKMSPDDREDVGPLYGRCVKISKEANVIVPHKFFE